MTAAIALAIMGGLLLPLFLATEEAVSAQVANTPDDRYGAGGTRVEFTDRNGRVVKRVWRDSSERTLEDETTSFGPEDEATVTTTIYNPTPDGRRLSRRTVRKVRRGTLLNPATNTVETLPDRELSLEEQIFDEKGNQTGGTKTEVAPGGRKRSYRWDGKGYVEVVAAVTPAAPGQSGSVAARGFGVASEVAGGLRTTTFSTPSGQIRVRLPDDMAAGDTLSGTVVAEPEGKDQKEKTRNQSELSGYVIEMEKQQTSSVGRILKLAVPAISTAAHVILRDKKGKEVARSAVPVAPQPPPVTEFDLPTLGQQGRPVEVRGPCDGDLGTTNVKLGGEDLEVVAESPRKIVALNTNEQVGPSDLEVKELGQTVKGEFRTLGITLSAPKLDLLRGERTTLTVVVSGLEGITEEVPLELENRSSSVINMVGGELQRLRISPLQVQGNTFTIERLLTGVQRGAFKIIGTVISGRRKPGGAPAAGTPHRVLAPGFPFSPRTSLAARCRESQSKRLETCQTAPCREGARQQLALCDELVTVDKDFGVLRPCNGLTPLQQCSVASPCNLDRDVDGDGANDSCVAGARCAPASEGNICDTGVLYDCYLATEYHPRSAVRPLAECECLCQ